MDRTQPTVTQNPKYTVPELKSTALRRQRLLDRLYENIDQQLQLVCAPAGYGKTTLLADFARDADLTVCWYSVDELDSDPLSFLGHLDESVRSRYSNFEGVRDTEQGSPSRSNANWYGVANQLIDAIQNEIPDFFRGLAGPPFQVTDSVAGYWTSTSSWIGTSYPPY